jgi:hypothetical protein
MLRWASIKIYLDRISTSLDRSLDGPRWASIDASLGFDRGLDRASIGRWTLIEASMAVNMGLLRPRWASIKPRWISIRLRYCVDKLR